MESQKLLLIKHWKKNFSLRTSMNPPVKKLWTSVTFPPNPQTRKLLACLSAGSGRPEPCPHTPRETRKENSRQEAHPQARGVATAARGPGRLRCRRPFPCFPAQEVSGSNGLYGRTVMKRQTVTSLWCRLRGCRVLIVLISQTSIFWWASN